nr:MAG TPA: hypothetical protein [Caudoviricetes sp.]
MLFVVKLMLKTVLGHMLDFRSLCILRLRGKMYFIYHLHHLLLWRLGILMHKHMPLLA